MIEKNDFNLCNFILNNKLKINFLLLIIFVVVVFFSYFLEYLDIKILFWSSLILLLFMNLVANGSYLFLRKMEVDGSDLDAYARIITIVTFYFSSIYFLFN